MSRESYTAAIARIPRHRCDCGALYHGPRCPYCGPAPVAAKPDFDAMRPDEAKAWLEKELFK